ncbi:MAG: insulinase family protein, partial [Ignavibacteria bacterium]|nr:insulinase family protein [Ignavibacteria bacterium]
MTKPGRSLIGSFVLMVTSAATLFGQLVAPHEFVLDNGMKVVMVEDHTVPSICFSIAFRVGSRNETAGITGISHLFEHMMFNGSAAFAPTQFDSILEAGGGYSNAYTSNDITFYYEEFNPDLLETVLVMESDRMRSLKVDSENLEQERGIVKEERRVSTDNSIPGAMFEELYAGAFVAHPYQNPVVGWMGDLDNIRLEDARDYFRVYYAPNNATVFVVGDFDPSFLTEKMVEYFAEIPPQEIPRPVVNSEPPQRGERRVVLRKEARLPSVAIGYKVPAVSSSDIFPLMLLSAILSDGRSSRLYKRLVYDLEAVTAVEATVDQYIDPGLFTVYAQMRTGMSA